MPSLSKKYKINYNKRYTIQKNKKSRGNKSIKVYNNRVKRLTRKRKHYMGGDIEVPPINNIFPSGETYQPNMDCLEKECDKGDAGEMTTTCLNTLIVMNLFSQNLDDFDDSEKKTMGRIGNKLTAEEKEQVDDLTKKYLTNYVDSLFSRSIFSKNNVDLTPENTQKLKELLQVIDPLYVDYLTRDSNLSDDIKEKILAVKQELNFVDNAVATPSPTNASATAPIDNAITPAPAPTNASATAPTSATASNTAVAEADQAKKDAEAEEVAKKATEDAEAARVKKAADEVEAERLRLEAEETAKKAAEDAEAAKKVAEAERLRVIAEIDQAKKAVINESLKADKIKITADELANKVYNDAIEEAEKIRTAAVEIANQDLDTNIQKKDRRYAYKHDRALKLANDAYNATKKKAEKVKNEAIAEAVKAQSNAKDAIKRKLSAKKNLLASQTMNNP